MLENPAALLMQRGEMIMMMMMMAMRIMLQMMMLVTMIIKIIVIMATIAMVMTTMPIRTNPAATIAMTISLSQWLYTLTHSNTLALQAAPAAVCCTWTRC